MKNRKNLHDYSLLLVVLAALELINLVAMAIGAVVNGTLADALSKVAPNIKGATEIVLMVFAALAVLLILAEAMIGFKGLKASRQPSAAKGYITAAKVFFVLSVLGTVSAVAGLFDKPVDMFDAIITLVNVVLDVVVYFLFIKAAKAVRAEFMAEQ